MSDSSKKPRRTKEEIEIAKVEKLNAMAAKKFERDARKKEEAEEKELRKLQRETPDSEETLVRKYAKRVIMNDRYHGRVDGDKFEGIAKTDSINKKLWMDTDFFFSVVFESSEQKMEFLAKSGMLKHAETTDEDYMAGDQVQIVNGVEYAKHLGIELKRETRKDYPTGNLDLMPFVLDNEEV